MGKMEHWLRALVDPGIKIGDVENIVGSKYPNPILNKQSLPSFKLFIKTDRREKYHAVEVKYSLAYQMQLEEYIALTNNKELQYQEVWNNVFNELCNINSGE